MVTVHSLGEALGAEVVDFSVDDLRPKLVSELEEAFFEHHLLCFRGPPVKAGEFAALARAFGEPQIQLIRKKRVADVPEVSVLESTYKRAEDKPSDLQQVRLSGWHTDDSYFAVPAKATLLQALDIPSAGGQTKFINTRKAWDDASAELKARIRDLKAVHKYDSARAFAPPEKRNSQELAETPDVVHPLVRTHEESGKKAIYFNPNRTDHVVGMSRSDSDALLDELYEYCTQDKYQYAHEWRLGDILLWDNRCLMHAVNTDFPVGERRRHQRILLKGAPPS